MRMGRAWCSGFRSARRRKGTPFLLGAVALTVIAVLIYLLIYLLVLNPEATTTVGDAESDRAVTAGRDEPSDKISPTEEARAALLRAEEYRREHPNEWDKIIVGYKGVVSRFSGTREASLAQKRIGEVEKEREKNSGGS